MFILEFRIQSLTRNGQKFFITMTSLASKVQNILSLLILIIMLLVSSINGCPLLRLQMIQKDLLLCVVQVLSNDEDGPDTCLSRSQGGSSFPLSTFFPIPFFWVRFDVCLIMLQSGYGAHVLDFHISKSTHYSPQEKIVSIL